MVTSVQNPVAQKQSMFDSTLDRIAESSAYNRSGVSTSGFVAKTTYFIKLPYVIILRGLINPALLMASRTYGEKLNAKCEKWDAKADSDLIVQYSTSAQKGDKAARKYLTLKVQSSSAQGLTLAKSELARTPEVAKLFSCVSNEFFAAKRVTAADLKKALKEAEAELKQLAGANTFKAKWACRTAQLNVDAKKAALTTAEKDAKALQCKLQTAKLLSYGNMSKVWSANAMEKASEATTFVATKSLEAVKWTAKKANEHKVAVALTGTTLVSLGLCYHFSIIPSLEDAKQMMPTFGSEAVQKVIPQTAGTATQEVTETVVEEFTNATI